MAFVDTVGLNSKNHTSSVSSLHSKLHSIEAQNFSIVVVVAKSERRWTMWTDILCDTIAQLFESKPKVIVYWDGTEALCADDRRDFSEILSEKDIIVATWMMLRLFPLPYSVLFAPKWKMPGTIN